MDSRRHRADTSMPDEATASTTPDTTPHHDSSDLDSTPSHRPEHNAPTPSVEPHDRLPHPSPADEHRDQHRDPDQHTEPEEPDRHTSDRSAEPPSTDTEPDPFASYPSELRAHMHHDDTLSRLQYLSNPLPEPDRVADETNGVVEVSGAAAQPEPSRTADTPPDVADSAKPTSADDELETATAQADESAQEPTTDLNRDAPTPSPWTPADSSADGTEGSTDPTDAATPTDTGRDSTTPTDDDTTSPPNRMSLATEVSGETVETRVDRWDPERANLPTRVPDGAQDAGVGDSEAKPMNLDEAVDYVTTMKSERPWLEPVTDCDPRIQRIHAGIDLGAGHAHIRHGAMGDDELYRRRVAYLEDPAQLDEAKRMAGVDGFKSDKMHFCADTATRINDATAFAVAYAGVVERPEVRQVLDAGADQAQPHALEIPLADLLGTDGHRFCSGYRLTGDWAESNAIRKEWVIARAEGQDVSGLQEPQTERISSFENGTMMVRFARNPSDQTFYIATMFVQPPPDED